MPDTLSREELAAIRERHNTATADTLYRDCRDLLAHIDALTAADAQRDDLLAALAERGIYSRFDLESRTLRRTVTNDPDARV